MTLTLSSNEYNAIDKFLMESHMIDILQIHQDEHFNDSFWDDEEGKFISIKEGLEIIVDAIAYPLSHYGITKEETKAFENLCASFDIPWVDCEV